MSGGQRMAAAAGLSPGTFHFVLSVSYSLVKEIRLYPTVNLTA